MQYWNLRYAKEDAPFEWFHDFSGLQPVLQPFLLPAATVLVVGCGNSGLSAAIAETKVANVISIDYSDVVIDKMAVKYKGKPNMQFMKMDATRLDLRNNSIDLVVDKGTMDSILCDSNGEEVVEKMLSEINRVLKPGGSYLTFTYGSPDMRVKYFEVPSFGWRLRNPITIPKPPVDDRSPSNPNSVFFCYHVEKPT